MTTDWTPRERQLRAALWEYRQCQRRMLDLWSDSDQHGKEILWRNLHRCEALADTALSTAPPPDPRDEALRLAEITVSRLRDTLNLLELTAPGYDFNSDPEYITLKTGEAYQMVESTLSSIAAVKGGE